MSGKLSLKTAEQERVRLTAAQQRQIQRLYENAAMHGEHGQYNKEEL